MDAILSKVLDFAKLYFNVYTNVKRGLIVITLTGGFITYKICGAIYHRIFSKIPKILIANIAENDIRGKIAVVTGASSGIGEAIAKALAAKGAKVILIARTQDKLEQVANEIKKSGGIADTFPCDLTNSSAVLQLVANVTEKYGTIDILINNAGAGKWLFLEETTDKDMQDALSTPFLSAFYVTKGFVGGMIKKNKGNIVMINTPAALASWAGAVGYTCSRRALLGLTSSLEMELWFTKIRVTNCIFGETASDYWKNNPGAEEKVPAISKMIGKLSCKQVADQVVKAIEQNKSEVIYPFMLATIAHMYKWNLLRPVVNSLTAWTGAKRQ